MSKRPAITRVRDDDEGDTSSKKDASPEGAQAFRLRDKKFDCRSVVSPVRGLTRCRGCHIFFTAIVTGAKTSSLDTKTFPGAMKEQKPTMLVIGDALVSSGFARVLDNILEALSADFSIHHLGVGYGGDPHDRPWKIYPANLGGDILGLNRVPKLTRALQPDVIFMLADIWNLARYKHVLNDIDHNAALVMYCPIDAGPVDGEDILPLYGVDRFVVYTQFAAREVQKAVDAATASGADFQFPAIDVMPHGTDTANFFPYRRDDIGQRSSQSRQMAIEELFGKDESLHDAFIVLNANRNQMRKRIDNTIRGFAEFAQGKPDNVKLYLHMGVEDEGWNLIRMARRYGIDKRLLLTTQHRGMQHVSDSRLNAIYNAACVGVNTSSAEGWGLVSFEHAATGAAQIVPGHTGCKELWESSAQLLPPRCTQVCHQIHREEHYVDPQDLAVALDRLYRDPEYLREQSVLAFNNATRPEYDWGAIAIRWRDLLWETVAREHLVPA